MAYCINCGQELAEGAKFCANCGKAVDDSNSTTQRKTVYDGAIHKCPNCGDILDAYEAVCESCGYERRGSDATSSVRELMAKLEEIEKTREKPIYTLRGTRKLDKTDEQKISLISSFPIPNNKEDLYEFFVLSKANIDMNAYEQDDEKSPQLIISNAWKAKLEQAYQKSKLVFSGTPLLQEIEKEYLSTNQKIKKSKFTIWRNLIIIIGGTILLSVVLVSLISLSVLPKENELKKENERLNGIVSEIYSAIENENYTMARLKSSELVFSVHNGYERDYEEDWEARRAEILAVINEAEGVSGVLEEEKIQSNEIAETENVNEQSEDIEPEEYSFFDDIASDFESSAETIKEVVGEMGSHIEDIKNQWKSIWNGEDTSQKTDLGNNADEHNSADTKLTNIEDYGISQDVIDKFTTGYEKADFYKYNSPAKENGLGGSKIYLLCTLEKTELLNTDNGTMIIGCVKDDSGNSWMIMLHLTLFASEELYSSYIGEDIVVRGVYSGYSGLKNMPAMVLEEFITCSTGETISGIQKYLDEGE